MKTRLLWIVVFCCVVLDAQAQTDGDYRSRVSGDWNQSSTWERYNGTSWITMPPSPQAADGIITILSSHTVTMTGDEVIDQVVVEGTLTIGVGINVIINTVSTNVLVVHGTLNLNSESNIQINTAAANALVVNGRVNAFPNVSGTNFTGTTGATANGVKFNAGSTYDHQYTTSAGTIPLATWALTSTCLIGSYTTNTAVPGNFSNQTFGNLTLDIAGFTGLNFSLNGLLTEVNGNLSLSTPSATKRIILGPASAAPYTLNVGGNLELLSGVIRLSDQISTGANVINVFGDYSQILGATVYMQVSGSGTCTLNIHGNYNRAGNMLGTNGKAGVVFSGTSPQQATINSVGVTSFTNFSIAAGSTLDLNSTAVNSSLNSNSGGTFTIRDGGVLRLASTSSSGAFSSSITGSFNKVFEDGSTIIFNGTGLQYMGSNYPPDDGLSTIIDNFGNGVVLDDPLSLNGDLVLQNGDFDITGNSITFGGTFTSNSNSIIVNDISSISIEDGGELNPFGPLVINGDLGALNLISASGRSLTLGSDLVIAGSLELFSGTIEMSDFELFTEGNISFFGGTLTSTTNSALSISGSGSIDGPIQIEGSEMQSLTIGYAAGSVPISGDFAITNLNLELGNLTLSGNVQMASGGIITKSNGNLTSAIGAVTSYNVEYIGGADITGLELPSDDTFLQDLTINSDASVFFLDPSLLTTPTVNGTLTVSSAVNGNGIPMRVRGNVILDAALDFTGSNFMVDGTSTFSGSVEPQFGGLEVTTAGALSLDVSIPQISMAEDFTMNGAITPGTSALQFNGTATQSIDRTTDATPIGLYQVVVDKTGGDVELLGPVSIANSIQFNSVTTMDAGTELLTLLSTDAFTARVNALPDGAVINGTVIAQRSFPNGTGEREYRYLASPVLSTTVADWQTETPITGTFLDPSPDAGLDTTFPTLYYYDETIGGLLDDRWVTYPPDGSAATGTPIVNGTGYALFVRSNTSTTIDSRGTLAQHQQVVNVTAGSPTGDDGWNLVGNPYPAPIDWSLVVKSAGVDNAVYIRDNTDLDGAGIGSVISHVNGVTSPGTSGFVGVIESGQGFWTHATASGTLTFEEGNKDTGAAQYYRTSDTEMDIARLFLTGSTSKDELVVRFKKGATANFEGTYDALKLSRSGFNLSSKSGDDRKLVINSIPEMEKEEEAIVPLVIENINAGTYTFTVNTEELIDKEVILWDQLTDTFTNLEEGFDLVVNGEEGQTIDGRFFLIFRESIITDLPSSLSNDIKLYPNPTNGNAYLVVNHFTEPTLHVSIVNVSGITVGSMKVANRNAGEEQTIELEMGTHPSGVYLIRVEDKKRLVQKRLIKVN